MRLLAEKAKKATAEEFIDLTNHVTELLANENGTFGKLHITGKLVEAPPSGEAIIVGDLHGDIESLIHILEESRVLEKLRKRQDVLLMLKNNPQIIGDYKKDIVFLKELELP